MAWKFLIRRSTLMDAQHCANLLECAGIRAEVRNRYLAGALGEIPPVEAWPQVWIPAVQDAEAALRSLREASSELSADCPPWRCPGCDEWIEPQFAACWQCGMARPSDEPAR